MIRTQTFDVKSLATVFDTNTHEIVSIGWIPTMALCVTISGFIIFFKNCRPFTTFRKFLYLITLAVVLFILWLAPEFFIVSGTEMVNEVGGVFSHIVPNLTLSLFRTMTLEQIIFVGAYAVIAVPLYLLNEKFGGKLLDLTLFAKREYKDE